MTAFKSEFSLGNGRLKEVAGLQYDDAAGGKLSASVLLALGAAGFSLDGATITGIAQGSAPYTSFNDALATQSYVLEQVAGVTPGIPGDATYIDFAGLTLASYASGNVVAINSTGLVLSDADSEADSNAIGVVVQKIGAGPTGTVRVQVDGQVALSTDLTAFANGDLVWVSPTAGAVGTYAGLASGDYAVQVGIVSDKDNDKIVLQPRVFGQVA